MAHICKLLRLCLVLLTGALASATPGASDAETSAQDETAMLQVHKQEHAFISHASGNFCVGPDKKWRCETPCEFSSQPCIDKYGAGSDCWKDPDQECLVDPPQPSTGNYCVGPDQKWRCETPCEFSSQPCIDKYGAGSDCWKDSDDVCGSPGPKGGIVASYIGARPSSLLPPPLSSVPSEVNLMMVCFSKNSPTGNFVSYDPALWKSLNIPADKRSHPGRKFLISLGGAAAWGGNFEISVPVNQWVSNTFASVERLIKEYSADGVEMQWEGKTNDANFVPAVTSLLAKLKSKGYTTAIGPFYGGTSRDYAKLPLDNVDFINMQMYAMDIQTVDRLVSSVNAAINEYPSSRRAEARKKFVLGLNSDNRNPNPNVGLSALKKISGISGLFTWDAEHSATTLNPPWCIEQLGSKILAGQNPSINCRWR